MQKLSSNQKAFASFVVLAFVLLGLYYTLPADVASKDFGGELSVSEKKFSDTNNVTQPAQSPVAQVARALSEANVKAVVSENSSDVKAGAAQTGADHKAWNLGSVKATTPSIPLNEQIAKYSIVEIDQHSNDLPKLGQLVEIPMLDGESVQVFVESVTENPNGDYTWSGHLRGYGTDYPVVMTYGENSVFATVTTPKGSYTMESVNGSGWLYKNPSEFELSKPGTKDFLEVDTSH